MKPTKIILTTAIAVATMIGSSHAASTLIGNKTANPLSTTSAKIDKQIENETKWALWVSQFGLSSTGRSHIVDVNIKAYFDTERECLEVTHPAYQLSGERLSVKCIPGKYKR